jgi:hypothetical protein
MPLGGCAGDAVPIILWGGWAFDVAPGTRRLERGVAISCDQGMSIAPSNPFECFH